MPERKQFPNGKWGERDEQGRWFLVDPPQPDQPAPTQTPAGMQTTPPTPHQNAPRSHEDGPGPMQNVLTKFGAPAAGFAIGGLAGGPPGAMLGATAGKAYGDLYNMFTGGDVPDPSQEAVDLAKEAVSAGVFAKGAPLLKHLPGGPTLAGVGLGAAGGAGAGYELGHPGLGTGLGALLGGYKMLAPALRGVGRATEFLTTPLASAIEQPSAGGAGGVSGAITAAERTSLAKQGYTPELIAKIEQQLGQQTRGPVPNKLGPKPKFQGASKPGTGFRVPSDMVPGAQQATTWSDPTEAAYEAAKTGRPHADVIAERQAYEQRAQRPQRQSTEIPFRIAEEDLPDYRSIDLNRSYSRPTLPDLSNDADTRWNAAVETPAGVQYHPEPQTPQWPSNLEQTTPEQSPWTELAQQLKPKRSAPGNYRVETPGGTPNAPVTRPDPGLVREQVGGGPPDIAEDRGIPTPRTVNDAKGLTLREQEAWNRFKQNNPGTTDDTLNSWYSTHGGGEYPPEGQPVEGLVNQLLNMLKGKR